MKVQGTQEHEPAKLEFSKDTVYVRKNIVRVEKEGTFSYWEYDETTYSYPEYVKVQQEDSDSIKLALAELAELIGG